jgi:hypothetical protein
MIWNLMTQLGCSPKIYLIDRQTVLEEEAAGEWPEFEKDLLEKSKSGNPSLLPKTTTSTQDNRSYHVLNGDLVRSRPSSKSPLSSTSSLE